MRLLVTRPEPEAHALAHEVRGLGHEPALQPLLEFQSLDFDQAQLSSAGALVFTSGNALRALREKRGLSGIERIPVFCAGSQTARRLQEAGFQTVAATADTAEELASRIISQASRGAKLIHVTGEHQAFDLAGALAREGLQLSTLHVYVMKAREAFDSGVAGDLRSGASGGVILMSPRTAEIFVALCRKHELLESAKALRYFGLAESVAKKLKPLEPAHVNIAAKPNREALLALIAALPPAGQNFAEEGR